jgi:hypothetical protein
MELTPVTLEGRHVRLVPLTAEHMPALWEVGNDADIWQWTLSHPQSEADMRRYVEAALAKQATGGGASLRHAGGGVGAGDREHALPQLGAAAPAR